MTQPQQPQVPQQPPPDLGAQEASAAALYLTLIAPWLTAVTAAVFPAPGIINPFGILSATTLWARIIGDWIRRAVRPVLLQPYQFLFGDRATVLFDQRPFVDQYLTTVTNLLVRVPDETFARVNALVQKASVEGTPIPQLAEQIRDTLLDAGAPYWTNRATTVARTELLRAHRAGSWDSYTTWGADNNVQLTKTWLDSDDARVRKAHVDTDEQTQPILAPFQVGVDGGPKFPAQYPGDPLLPPDSAINCRCNMLINAVGETPTDLSDRRFRSTLT